MVKFGGIKFGTGKVMIVGRRSSIDPKVLGEAVKRADSSQFLEAAKRCAHPGEPHEVEIYYWRFSEYMTMAMLRHKPAEEDIIQGYALMWKGQMHLHGANIEANLDEIFSNLQDDGTYYYFTQDEVRAKLQPEPHTSMSVGDIISIDGQQYLCVPGGWEAL